MQVSIAAAIILCIFIYWGWDACLAVGEETKNSGRTPGRRGRHHHADPRVHLRAGCLRRAVVRRFRLRGYRSEQRDEHRRCPDRSGRAGRGHHRGVSAASDGFGVGVVVHPDHDPADRARNPLDGRVRGHTEAVRECAPALHDPCVRHRRDGLRGAGLLPAADLHQRERAGRLGGVTGPGGRVLLRHHRLLVHLVLPPHPFRIDAKPVHARYLPVAGRSGDDAGPSSRAPST